MLKKKHILHMKKVGNSYAEICHHLEFSKSTIVLWVKQTEGCKEGCISLYLSSLGGFVRPQGPLIIFFLGEM